jgi:exodeoxyribonuclease V gamma subunit
VPSRSARTLLHVHHPLQPFSPAYFAPVSQPDRALFTFDGRMARGVRAAQHRREHPTPFLDPLPIVPPLARDSLRAPEPWLRVSVEELVDAWSHPARWYCRQVLQMDVRRGADRLDDVEPLTVDPLLRTRMQQQLLQHALQGQQISDDFLAYVLAGGELPPGALGDSWMERLHHDIQPLLVRLQTSRRQPPMTVDIVGADWQLQGTLDLQVDGGQWCVRAAKLKARDHLLAWVLHLVRAAAAEGGITWLYGTDGAAKLTPLTAAQAMARLDALVHGFRIMSRMPVPFFTQSAWAYREMHRKGAVDQDKLLGDFEANGEYAIGADGSDDHVRALWRGIRPLEVLWVEFSSWCDVFWQDHEVTSA